MDVAFWEQVYLFINLARYIKHFAFCAAFNLALETLNQAIGNSHSWPFVLSLFLKRNTSLLRLHIEQSRGDFERFA